MDDYKKEIDRLIQIVNTSAVNRISAPFKVEDAYKPKAKEELKEAIRVMADTPEEHVKSITTEQEDDSNVIKLRFN